MDNIYLKEIIKKILYMEKYKEYTYIYKINIKDIQKIGIKFLISFLNKNNLKNLNILIDNINEYNLLIKLIEYTSKIGINLNIFYEIKAKDIYLNSNINKIEGIKYILNFKYNISEKKWLIKNLNIFSNKNEFYLDLNTFKNQNQINNSYFLDIFNIIRNKGYLINTNFIRYESAYKNLYVIGPKEINFDLSEYCNANCIFCNTNGPGYLNNRDNNENRYKQQTNIKNLIQILKDSDYLGTEELTIGITGEPFIDKYIVGTFLDEIKKTNLKIGFLTNGYSLINNIEQIINTKNIKHFYINISAGDIDSFKKTRIGDKFYNFLNTWKSIKEIKERRSDIKIKALYVVTPLNYKGIENFIKLSIKNKVDEIELKEVVNYGFNNELQFSKQIIDEIIEILDKIKNNIIKNNIIDFNNSLNNKKKNNNSIIIEKCYNHYLYSSIVRNSLYTCCKFLFQVGKISNGKLLDVYKNIKENNKIFLASKSLEKGLGKEKHIEKCSRCFHVENIKKIEKYIKLKNE